MKKLTKISIILVIINVLISNLYAGTPIRVWQKTYGGSKGDDAHAITPTKDGGFIVVGSTWSFGNGKSDVYLIKIDKNGNKIWQKTFGGSNIEYGEAITPTKDGDFIVAGETYSFGNGNKDVYLIKIDKNGNKIWQKTFGGRKEDYASAITPTKDGGFIVAGYTYSFGDGKSDAYLIKIDKNGNKIWQKTFESVSGGEAITPTKDGGFIVAGNTESYGDDKSDVYIIKIDKNGNKIWQKTFGGRKGDYASAITPTKDGGFIVAGETKSFGDGVGSVYLIKIDKNGKKIWQKTFESVSKGEAITPTKDGGFIVAGVKLSFSQDDVYLIKIDKNGKKIWQKTFGGNDYDEAYAITLTKDGGFIVAGHTGSAPLGGDVYLIKIKISIKNSPKQSISSSSTSSKKSVSVESNCYKNTCTVKVNGSYYNAITYKYNSRGVYEGCYTFYGLGVSFYYCPNYFDSNSKLNGPCGKTSAYSLHNAMEKIANCKVNGHY